MRLLVDTHIFLWLMTEPDRVREAARIACRDSANELVLSVVSLWEIQIKAGLGKLTLHVPLREMILDQVDRGPFSLLPVVAEHVLALESLPAHHSDPFDRLLVAQAKAEDLWLVSQDRKIEAYRGLVQLLA